MKFRIGNAAVPWVWKSGVRLIALVAIAAFAHVAAAQTHGDLETQCHGSDAPAAVAACTSLIQSGERDGELATTLTLRGVAYIRSHDYRPAIADFDQAVKLSPRDAAAFANRGNAYFALNDYDRALKDYDDALRLDAASAHILANRGNVYLEKQDYAHAIQDYSQAILLDGTRAETLRDRGVAYALTRQMDRAKRDFARASEVDPADGYTWLWFAIASPKGDASLGSKAAAVSRDRWPGPLVAIFQGETSAEKVRAANAALADAELKASQSCEAAFYLGERALLQGQTDNARTLLQEATTVCPHSYVEYHSAATELARLH